MRFHSGETNDLVKWVCRIVGWLLTWLGMQMMVGPLTVFPDIVRPASPPPPLPSLLLKRSCGPADSRRRSVPGRRHWVYALCYDVHGKFRHLREYTHLSFASSDRK